MLSRVKQYIIKIKTAAGVELTFLENGDYVMNISLAHVKKGRIIHEALPTVFRVEDISTVLQKQIPVFITFQGKGVLSRKLEAGRNEKNIPTEILPNANIKDYYYDLVKGENNDVAFIARVDIVNNVLSKINESGLKILGFSLGFGSIQKIIKYILFEKSPVIRTTNYEITYNQQRNIEHYSNKSIQENIQQEEYSLADQYIKSGNLLPFAMAVCGLSDIYGESEILSNEYIIQTRKDYFDSKIFKAASWIGLSLVLFILLINFLIYSYYFNKNQELQLVNSYSASETVKTDSIVRSVNELEGFLASNRWKGQSMSSFLADRIAGMVPDGVQLNSMNIYPANSEGTAFKNDTIVISGIAADASEVNQFTSNIKSIKHISGAIVKNYQYKREKETGIFNVEVITVR